MPAEPHPPSPADAAEIAAFAAWARDHEITASRAARLLGISGGTYNQLCNSKYPADYAPHVATMRRVRARHAEQAAAVPDPAHAQIRNTQIVAELVRSCQIARSLGFVCGESGYSKTDAALAYVHAHPAEAVIVRIIPDMSLNWLLHRLGRALGLRPPATCEGHYESIREYLEGREANIVVLLDEIDYAPIRLVQAIRDLHDEARCAMVWLGTEDFLRRLQTAGTGAAKQILRRVQFTVVLSALSQSDSDAILAPYGLADPGLRRRAHELAGGDARRLAKGVVMARHLARDAGEPLALAHLTDGFALLIAAG